MTALYQLSYATFNPATGILHANFGLVYREIGCIELHLHRIGIYFAKYSDNCWWKLTIAFWKYPNIKWLSALVFTVSWIAQAASRSSSCSVSFTNSASRWASSSEVVWSSVCRLIIPGNRKVEYSILCNRFDCSSSLMKSYELQRSWKWDNNKWGLPERKYGKRINTLVLG